MDTNTKSIFDNYLNFCQDACSATQKMMETFIQEPSTLHDPIISTENKEKTKAFREFLTPTMNTLNSAFLKWVTSLSDQDEGWVTQKKELCDQYIKLNQYFVERLQGKESKPVVESHKKDFVLKMKTGITISFLMSQNSFTLFMQIGC